MVKHIVMLRLLPEAHGNTREPKFDPTPRATPLGRLLDVVLSARADLNFREDGIETTLTIRRKK